MWDWILYMIKIYNDYIFYPLSFSDDIYVSIIHQITYYI
jgi:hypothetical protein